MLVKQENLYIELSQVFKQLSVPIRLKLLQFISYAPRTVEECADSFGQSVQAISRHLLSMAKANILHVKKDRNYRIYSVSNKSYIDLFTHSFFYESHSLLNDSLIYKKDIDTLAHEVRDKKVFLIDLRAPKERDYIPMTNAYDFSGEPRDLESFLQGLPQKQKYISICRGSWCERLNAITKKAKQLGIAIQAYPVNANELEKLNREILKGIKKATP